MKILDRYILLSYLKLFFSVLTILYFIFILQAFWMFIDKFAGKDIDTQTVIEFLIYFTPNLVPMVLPLSVLLAAIMSFGSLSEHYEFAAMKSAGVSLQRAMRPLIVFILILAGVSFWFANNISPKMEYRFKQKKQQILKAKPEMAITPGQFISINKMTIKVNEKTGKDGRNLKDVTIHLKNSSGITNKTVIKADSGQIASPKNSSILKLKLFNGTYYEDVENKNSFSSKNQKQPFAKANFEEYTIGMDLSSLENQEEDGDINQTAGMMNISQLSYTIDSLNLEKEKEKEIFLEGNLRNIVGAENIKAPYYVLYKKQSLEETINELTPVQQVNLFQNAINSAESQSMTTLNNFQVLNNQQKNINSHWISFNEKFVIAFSCLLMFFIGAPLGAIIRKGGIGLPIILAMLIFITFHFTNTFGRKLAGENGISPFLGTWISTIILIPLAVSFTYKATKDRGINSMDTIKYYFSEIIKKLKKKKNV